MSQEISAPDAVHLSRSSLPVIDICGLSSASIESRRAVGRALRDACVDKGFLYIVNHGVPHALIDDMFRQARAFFNLPQERKQALSLANSPCRHGYEPLKEQTLHAGTQPDIKEGYYIGRESSMGSQPMPHLFGANQWPYWLPGFRPVLEAYFNQMLALSETMMNGIALSLGLSEDYFNYFCIDPIARLRLLHYPDHPRDAKPGEQGAGAHTDYGGLTILLQDDLGGLQVFDHKRDEWLHADPIPGSFVVNLGDMISRWTNDTYRSTLHRVINLSGKERCSIPFFFHGNPDHQVACIPTCLAPGEEPRYPATTVERHFMRRMDQSYQKS